MLRKVNKKILGFIAIVGLNIYGVAQAVIIDDGTLPPILKGIANSVAVPTEEKQAILNVNSIRGNGSFSCVNSTLTSKSKMSGTLKVDTTMIKVSGVCFNPSSSSVKIEIIGTAGGSPVRLSGDLLRSLEDKATLKGNIRINDKVYSLDLTE